MSQPTVASFHSRVYDYYRLNGRHDLPWRQLVNGQIDPYYILVSELMLQQTQVTRVIPKYQSFIAQFPSAKALASSPLKDVLTSWSGLGYNRRARYLHQAAQTIEETFQGVVPSSVEALTQLPGVGVNTAGAIIAYAFNQPAVFIETNIRTVYIHHYFEKQAVVSDRELMTLVRGTLDAQNPREWYWALMDYGSFLKQTSQTNVSRSKHFVKQSPFEGSQRQLRGKVVAKLTAGPQTNAQLKASFPDDRLPAVLNALVAEGLVRETNNGYRL